MNIVNANYTEFGWINVVVEDMPEGMSITVPDDMANRDRQDLAKWEAEGNAITEYTPPFMPPPAMMEEPVSRAEFDALEARVAALENAGA